MERYATAIEDGVLVLEAGEERVTVGDLDAIVEMVGGETVTIEYESDHSQVVDWLDLDEDNTFSFDVRETLEEMDFPETFVTKLRERDADGHPSERAEFFAETMHTVWTSKGNLDDEENPFL